MRHRVAAFSLCVLILTLLVGATSPAAAAPGGNSAAAKACEEGGYRNYTRSDSTAFRNEGQCTKYAAQGGTLTPVATPYVVVTVGALDGQYCLVTITLEDAAPGTKVSVVVTTSTPAQFRPVLTAPNDVQETGFITEGMSLESVSAQLLDEEYIETVYIRAHYSVAVCGA